jgi:hypothetical protein
MREDDATRPLRSRMGLASFQRRRLSSDGHPAAVAGNGRPFLFDVTRSRHKKGESARPSAERAWVGDEDFDDIIRTKGGRPCPSATIPSWER